MALKKKRSIYTQAEFDEALLKILGRYVIANVRNRPDQGRIAIREIFLERLERDPAMKRYCRIIRSGERKLSKYGHYYFKGDPDQ